MNFPFLTRHRVSLLCAVTLVAIIPGCRERGADVVSEKMQMGAPAVGIAVPEADLSRAGARPEKVAFTAAGRGAPPVAPRQATPAQAPSTAPSMIIRNGDVSVEVDSLESAMEAVRRLAASLGGYIGNVSVSNGEHQVRSASLEMKIPANRFDDAMTGMQPLGKVQRSTATAQDVGEEFVDITARIANAKRLEARLVTLLATRTGKLEDVLAVERELARVREEIERYEGRLRYLSTHITTSTIVATVHEKAPLVATTPGRDPIRLAFVNMWRNFVLFVAWGIESLGVLIPVAALALLVARGWKRWRPTRSPVVAGG